MKGKVKYNAGFVNTSSGQKIETQKDAWKAEADCGCGIDCCNNLIALKANDDNGTTQYPATLEIVVIGGVVKGKVTIDLGAGNVVKYVDFT